MIHRHHLLITKWFAEWVLIAALLDHFWLAWRTESERQLQFQDCKAEIQRMVKIFIVREIGHMWRSCKTRGVGDSNRCVNPNFGAELHSELSCRVWKTILQYIFSCKTFSQSSLAWRAYKCCNLMDECRLHVHDCSLLACTRHTGHVKWLNIVNDGIQLLTHPLQSLSHGFQPLCWSVYMYSCRGACTCSNHHHVEQTAMK